MRILVLGSDGQIGSHLVKYLENLNHTVVRWDNASEFEKDLRIVNDKFEVEVSDSDFVFFLAFDVGGSRYLSKYQNTYSFLNNNIKIMDNVFNVLNKTKKPFIFLSSQMSNMIHSPYGITKLVGESYTKTIGGLSVRLWNVYGLESDPEKFHVITDFINMARNDGYIKMMTDGKESRDLLYVEDCCEGLVNVMENYENISSEENLCLASFENVTIKEVADIIAEKYSVNVIAGDKIDLIQLDMKNQPGQEILKYWSPKTALRDGIYKIVEEMENR
jgi:nucleoside-diphosphate-sugar epimerase